MKGILMILWLLAGNLLLLFAQNVVRCRIVSPSGQPIAGVSVKDENGNTLAISDSLGYFALKKPTPEKITASHMGYQHRQFHISHQGTGLISLVMEPTATLIEEVEISTGFQQVPKERATGAFSQIGNARFNEQVSSDVLSRLEAVANGLNIERVASTSSEMGIRIRGLSTLSLGAIRDPLIILDNFPYEGDLNNINPNDVENITLLKDAAAASIWGARAGNGVIVITTKRSSYNQPLRINLNTNFTVGGRPDLDYYPLMSSKDYIEAERFLFANNYRFSDTAAVSKPSFSPVYEILFRQRRGEITSQEADALLNGLAQVEVRDQYLQYMYKPLLNQQYALDLQGGNNNTAWYVSAGYDRNRSTLSAVNNRFNINFRNTYTPFKSLQLQVGLMYTQSKSENGRTGYTRADMPPYTLIADDAGNPLPVTRAIRQPFLDTLGGGKLLDWNYYPLTDDSHIDNQTVQNHTLLNFGMNYKPLHWLNLDIRYQYGRQQTRNDLLRQEGSYFTRALINSYSQINPVTGKVDYVVPRGAILDLSRGYLESHNLRWQINLHETWQAHEISALIGTEASHRNTNGNTNRTYGYDPDILTFNQVDYNSRFPFLVSGSNAFIPQNHDFNDQTHRFVSAFANAAYTYASKYTASLSARRDASNQFGVKFNDRWNLLWSAGLGWEVSKEPFYHVGMLPYLRFRGTYGFSGNTDLSRSAVTTVLYQSISPFFNAPMAAISQDGNPELGWEKVRMINIAADFRSKNNRISGSLDYFFKYGTDLFGPDPIDYTTGISGTITRNIASLKGRGLDVELNSLNIKGNFTWNSNLNFSAYTDRVVKFYQAPNANASQHVVSAGSMTRIEGQHLYSLYSYRWGGLDPQTGDPIGFIEGEPSKNYSSITGAGAQMEDLVNHGSAVPLFYGSLGNTFSYKNIGVTVRMLFKLDYYVRNEGISYGSLGDIVGHAEYAKRWRQPGDELITNVPSMVYPNPGGRDNFYNQSEIRVIRGDHIRLQYLSFYYDLINRDTRLLPFRSFRLYASISNLGLLWRASRVGVDPEYGMEGLPPATTYSFGLRFSL